MAFTNPKEDFKLTDSEMKERCLYEPSMADILWYETMTASYLRIFIIRYLYGANYWVRHCQKKLKRYKRSAALFKS